MGGDAVEDAAQILAENAGEVFFSGQLVLRDLDEELEEAPAFHAEHERIPGVFVHERGAAETVSVAGFEDVLGGHAMVIVADDRTRFIDNAVAGSQDAIVNVNVLAAFERSARAEAVVEPAKLVERGFAE